MNDELLFADDEDDDVPQDSGTWTILIVDDEPEVHAVTKLALSDFVLNGKSLSFLSAYSGAEAVELFRQHDDIAIVLLDVVMETDDAGLRVADFIRNQQHNYYTRIILRTGQPGQAPERDVIVNYDINDYKSKTELTSRKLFSAVISALRSYRDIMAIEAHRRGLEKVLAASTDVFSREALGPLMEGLIQQLSSILGCSGNCAYITSAVAENISGAQKGLDDLIIYAGNGEYAEQRGKHLREALAGDKLTSCQLAMRNKDIVFANDHIAAYCGGQDDSVAILYLSGLRRPVNEDDKKLIALFSKNVQLAFDNVLRLKQCQEKQSNIIQRLSAASDLGDATNIRTMRIVAMCDALAKELDLPAETRHNLRLAIPIMGLEHSHFATALVTGSDIELANGRKAMREHCRDIRFADQTQALPFMKMAEELSYQHHYRWCTITVSQHLALESSLVGAVAVLDTLSNHPSYAHEWDQQSIHAFFDRQANVAFSPAVVAALLTSIDTIERIQRALPDTLLQNDN